MGGPQTKPLVSNVQEAHHSTPLTGKEVRRLGKGCCITYILYIYTIPKGFRRDTDFLQVPHLQVTVAVCLFCYCDSSA